jgi:siroheme synthase (precorrin-2 oxidase/ferrochelatase)
MHKPVRQNSTANSREAFSSAVVSKCQDCKTACSLCFFQIVNHFRRLLDKSHFLLPFLGARFPLEAAVGTNGRVWVTAKEVKQIIAITRCIEAVDPDGGNMDEAALKKFFGTLDI